jgi:hypothetical protein
LKAVKNILILKSGNSEGVGEQFIQAMCAQYPKDHIFRYNLVAKEASLPILSSYYYLKFKNSVHKEVGAIQNEILRNKIDVVWVVLNSSSLIQVGFHLLKKINTPFVAHIWDIPEYLAKTSRLDYFSQKSILNSFDVICSKAQSIVATSDSMANMYGEKYKKSTTTIYFPSSKTTFSKEREENNEAVIKVIFAGSLYAYKEWKYFLKAIEEHNTNSKKPTIAVSFLGTPSKWAYKPSWVTFEKSLPQKEALQKVAEADIAYLPYWMDKKHEKTVMTAFPSKLSFYTSAGTPIFYHGPEKSTPFIFLETNKVGLSCTSIAKNDIISTLLELKSKHFLEQYSKTRNQTFDQYFSINAASEAMENVVNAIIQDK